MTIISATSYDEHDEDDDDDDGDADDGHDDEDDDDDDDDDDDEEEEEDEDEDEDERDDSATSDRASLETGVSCLVSVLPKVLGRSFKTCCACLTV